MTATHWMGAQRGGTDWPLVAISDSYFDSLASGPRVSLRWDLRGLFIGVYWRRDPVMRDDKEGVTDKRLQAAEDWPLPEGRNHQPIEAYKWTLRMSLIPSVILRIEWITKVESK